MSSPVAVAPATARNTPAAAISLARFTFTEYFAATMLSRISQVVLNASAAQTLVIDPIRNKNLIRPTSSHHASARTEAPAIAWILALCCV